VFNEVISNVSLIDGTGAPARMADVAFANGLIEAIGEPGSLHADAASVTDGDGLILCPGFIDPHTHYDAQLHWDPTASPSNNHGVTTVIGGNCGFTLAPLRARDGDYTRRMMARVEGMPLAALESGVDWNWETFADYLNSLDGRIAVNAGFLVGHCAIRRYVMGESAIGNEATDSQITEMVQLLRASLLAGGLGFSTSLSKTHSDGDGEPVASRWASEAEVLALCEETGRHEGTTLEAIIDGCLDGFQQHEAEMFGRMSAIANRPLNWNVLTIDKDNPSFAAKQLGAADVATSLGGKVVALSMPVLVPMNMSFNTFCGLWLLPNWQEVLNVPVAERIDRLNSAEIRAKLLRSSHSPEAGVFRRLADWDRYVIGDTYSDANAGLKGQIIGDLAAARGIDPFDCLIDVVVNDGLRTVLWPMPNDNDEASWSQRKSVWHDERAMIGGSDAGAHLDRMAGAMYTTRFIGDMLRGRQLLSVEQAIQMITQAPAALFGLSDRGVVETGKRADLVLFDPLTIDSEPASLVNDLPGGSARLIANSVGIRRVWVNGVLTQHDGQSTGAVPGTLLRSGRNTTTVLAR
jgi:N-acyl-D-aspartate/D-glutamate deacylase